MAQQKPHDVNEPSRRRLLKGIGALGGALAITGGCPVAHAAKATALIILSIKCIVEKMEFLMVQCKNFQFL